MSAPRSTAAAVVLAQAARALAAVALDGRAADVALAQVTREGMPAAAIRAVTLGSLRWYPRLEPVVAGLLAGRPVAPLLRMLLIGALHQLEYSRNPPAASLSSAVDAVRRLEEPGAAGLVNALLRRFLREREALLSAALQSQAAAAAHPQWLFDRLHEAWPGEWEQITAANNAHPPMTLRIDLNRTSVADYLAALAECGCPGRALPWLPAAIVLDRPVAVAQLPGFADGRVCVQDAGAQLASALLDVEPGQRVLDACAAPGGKTGALLEAADPLEVTAIDVDPGRLARVAENLQRLGRKATLVTADLREAGTWWDGRPFDRILLDAPCSATGVIRRHPDIKLLRRPEDLPALEASQQALLAQCLRWLRPGGRLLYCTCSVLPEENERSIAAALAAHPRAREIPLAAHRLRPAEALARTHGIQLLPGSAALADGFYYACLTVT